MIVADSGARKMHTLDLTAAGHKCFLYNNKISVFICFTF